MKTVMASDHRGLELKKKITEIFNHKGWELEDLGPFDDTSADYPDFAGYVCKKVQSGDYLGILICGSGIGMSIAANKYRGIRAALCYNVKAAEMARRHNDANVLVLSADYTDENTLKELLEAFFTSEFEGGRHARRVNKIIANEELGI